MGHIIQLRSHPGRSGLGAWLNAIGMRVHDNAPPLNDPQQAHDKAAPTAWVIDYKSIPFIVMLIDYVMTNR